MVTFAGPPAETEPGIGALTLPGLLAEVTDRYAEREALTFHDPSGPITRWSYRDLAEQVCLRAKGLIAAGAGKGTRVALLMGNRPEWVAWAFAVVSAGGVLVPVNTLLEPPEIQWVLRHCDAGFVIHQARLGHHDYEAQLQELEARLPFLVGRSCLGSREEETLLAAGHQVEDGLLAQRVQELSPFDDAVITYTSGSTGLPKGVLHSHRPPALQSWRFARHLGLDSTVRVWSAFPFFWTAGFCMVMGATLAAGGCLVLQERFEPGEALRLLEVERVTTPHAWPHHLAALEAHSEWLRRDLHTLRHVEAFHGFGRHPSVHVDDEWSPRAAYGLTETFTIVTSVPSQTPPRDREGHHGELLPGNSIRIVQPETNQPLGIGEIGEIRVKGPTLMRAYVKTAPESVFDEDGFFPSADAGWMDEGGRLHWEGRLNDMVKTGGANVSPVEIENVLLHHPGLEGAVVVGVPDETLGEMVVACAVVFPGASATEESVRDFLRGKLASYKLPRRVLFFDERELVLTGSAKVRLPELRQMVEERLEREAQQVRGSLG